MNQHSRILAIETSCDETAAAVVRDGYEILSNVIASQTELHAQFGGIFPEVASRKHIEVIYAVIERAIREAHIGYNDLDAIAVTRGPGLVGSLLVGVNAAKGLAIARGIPLLGVNHIEGHIYSLWLQETQPEFEFPIINLIVSGGHTELYLMTDHLTFRHLGGTLDDAAGEAFDKVGRLLGLPYPGGPHIDKAAKSGNENAFRLPRAVMGNGYNFSFSGLKTAVMRETRKYESGTNVHVNDMAASFQKAVVDVLVRKTLSAARETKAKAIHIAGGVSANSELRATMTEQASIPVRYPPLVLCTDNAAMIAAAAHQRYVRGQRDTLDFDVVPNLQIA
ncbi:MAG: tRNA (adenosine(37)-N6)-threonylcarbamoyltransferase complex transferase subunit TsaD [Candidatus Promineifilaceae bacterium]